MAEKDIVEKLSDPEVWDSFFRYKKEGGHMTRREEEALAAFIRDREYLGPAALVRSGGPFPHPSVTVLNKKGSSKKRTVFTFPEAGNNLLKLITWLLGGYDFIFSDNLYSFRRDTGVKQAMHRLMSTDGIGSMYSYNTDISDYFNSVSPGLIIPMLESVLSEKDGRLLAFLKSMLLDPYAEREGEEVVMKKGIMAGAPTSAFMADLFLADLDRSFAERGIPYARYSDDIIVFAESAEKIAEYEAEIKNAIHVLGLSVNESKERRTSPGEPWEFLGFRSDGRTVDISRTAAEKLKKKMKRKAKAILRWKERKGATAERAVRTFFRFCRRKLFDNPVHSEITWCRWYFPLINTDATLKELDGYLRDCARFVACGRWSTARFSFTAPQLREWGYANLVNRYYRFKNGETGKRV